MKIILGFNTLQVQHEPKYQGENKNACHARAVVLGG